jgi:hypothetical protein
MPTTASALLFVAAVFVVTVMGDATPALLAPTARLAAIVVIGFAVTILLAVSPWPRPAPESVLCLATLAVLAVGLARYVRSQRYARKHTDYYAAELPDTEGTESEVADHLSPATRDRPISGNPAVLCCVAWEPLRWLTNRK